MCIRDSYGTVTTGIVSRVTARAIQTDAAANPGNSGGPALDKNGHVVGVLVGGGGENINFAVPIRLACAKLRRCLLYTSDAADERSSVDLGGRRIIKKK